MERFQEVSAVQPVSVRQAVTPVRQVSAELLEAEAWRERAARAASEGRPVMRALAVSPVRGEKWARADLVEPAALAAQEELVARAVKAAKAEPVAYPELPEPVVKAARRVQGDSLEPAAPQTVEKAARPVRVEQVVQAEREILQEKMAKMVLPEIPAQMAIQALLALMARPEMMGPLPESMVTMARPGKSVRPVTKAKRVLKVRPEPTAQPVKWVKPVSLELSLARVLLEMTELLEMTAKTERRERTA
jgi:hypothetical protein